MQNQFARRPLFRGFGLLLFLIVSGCWLFWREIRQQKLNRALILAIERGEVKAAVDLLDLGADPDASDAPQSEALPWRLLWDRMRGVAIRTETGTPALLLAVNSPCEKANIDRQSDQASVRIVSALLDHGADVRLKDSDGFDVVYDSVLSACDDQILRLLIGRHADVNLHSPAGGRTPLMNAAGWGSPEEIRLLLDSGAKINDRDADGRTALMYAVSKSLDDNVAALLSRRADMNIKDKTGASPLSVAQSGLVSNTTTSNNHGAEHETWSNIVRLFVDVGKSASR